MGFYSYQSEKKILQFVGAGFCDFLAIPSTLMKEQKLEGNIMENDVLDNSVRKSCVVVEMFEMEVV